MIRFINVFLVAAFTIILQSCVSSSSTTTVARGVYLSNYSHVVLGNDNDGDAELNDIMMMVENVLAQRYITTTPSQARDLISQGVFVLSPSINVKTEKWEGGHTFITITFYDYGTSQRIAVVKSSGIGLSISQDQQLALKGIKKELDKLFNSK